jgi:PTS system mannose-specific IIB component
MWVRVDNRLVHGQVVETWLPYSKANVMVLANDDLVEDQLRQEIIKLAIPSGVDLVFTCITETAETLEWYCEHHVCSQVFLLFASCPDARKALEYGLHFNTLNIGNIHYAPGKDQICDHIALSQEDKSCLRFFQEKGVSLDFRCIPGSEVHLKRMW